MPRGSFDGYGPRAPGGLRQTFPSTFSHEDSRFSQLRIGPEITRATREVLRDGPLCRFYPSAWSLKPGRSDLAAWPPTGTTLPPEVLTRIPESWRTSVGLTLQYHLSRTRRKINPSSELRSGFSSPQHPPVPLAPGLQQSCATHGLGESCTRVTEGFYRNRNMYAGSASSGRTRTRLFIRKITTRSLPQYRRARFLPACPVGAAQRDRRAQSQCCQTLRRRTVSCGKCAGPLEFPMST